MILFPNAKINLGLNITGKRTDGYHNLETVFYPLMIKDAIELVESPDPGADQNPFVFSHSGNDISGAIENNLCYKAWALIKKDFPAIPPVFFHLHKSIPMGGGLGGGSADASFTLMLLNKKFGLGITIEKMISYASQLGSDCPFFIYNRPVFAEGRGEIMEEINLNLKGYHIVIVFPRIHVSTPWAFKQITPVSPVTSLKEIIQRPIVSWKESMNNDFEPAVFKAHPEIGWIKTRLYESGALYASLSGSGSTVFGIFQPLDFVEPDFPDHYFTQILELT